MIVRSGGLLLLPRSDQRVDSYSHAGTSPSPSPSSSPPLERPGPRLKRRRVVVEEDGEEEDEGPAPSPGESLSASCRVASWRGLSSGTYDLALTCPPLYRGVVASLEPCPSSYVITAAA